MESIVFDTGPIISLTLNSLLWLLEPLKEQFKGEFYITPAVYNELIRRPLDTRKYKFEALQILPYISKGIIKIIDNKIIRSKTDKILNLANNCFKAHDNWIKIVHPGETEVVATAILLNASCIVIDERVTRKLIEDPNGLKDQLQEKLHTEVFVNYDKLEELRKELGDIKVIRSAELVTIAYELKFLDKYILDEEKKIIKNLEKAVLEGALWAVKLNGCSIRRDEIDQILKIEK